MCDNHSLESVPSEIQTAISETRRLKIQKYRLMEQVEILNSQILEQERFLEAHCSHVWVRDNTYDPCRTPLICRICKTTNL